MGIVLRVNYLDLLLLPTINLTSDDIMNFVMGGTVSSQSNGLKVVAKYWTGCV